MGRPSKQKIISKAPVPIYPYPSISSLHREVPATSSTETPTILAPREQLPLISASVSQVANSPTSRAIRKNNKKRSGSNRWDEVDIGSTDNKSSVVRFSDLLLGNDGKLLKLCINQKKNPKTGKKSRNSLGAVTRQAQQHFEEKNVFSRTDKKFKTYFIQTLMPRYRETYAFARHHTTNANSQDPESIEYKQLEARLELKMYRFRDFEKVLENNKKIDEFICHNSSEIPLPNINKMKRTATLPQRQQESEDEDSEDSEDDESILSSVGGIDQWFKRNILKDQCKGRLDLLYQLAKDRNLPLEQVMEEAKKIHDDVYKNDSNI